MSFEITYVSYTKRYQQAKERNGSGNFAVRKKKNEQPTHKTAHSQAPAHKPMLQLAKELFSCQRTREKLIHL